MDFPAAAHSQAVHESVPNSPLVNNRQEHCLGFAALLFVARETEMPELRHAELQNSGKDTQHRHLHGINTMFRINKD